MATITAKAFTTAYDMQRDSTLANQPKPTVLTASKAFPTPMFKHLRHVPDVIFRQLASFDSMKALEKFAEQHKSATRSKAHDDGTIITTIALGPSVTSCTNLVSSYMLGIVANHAAKEFRLTLRVNKSRSLPDIVYRATNLDSLDDVFDLIQAAVQAVESFDEIIGCENKKSLETTEALSLMHDM